MKRINRKTALAAMMAASLAAMARPAAATDYYWDHDGAATADGGTGNWSANAWLSGSATGTLTTWTNSASSNAFLGGVSGTLTIDTGETAGVTMGTLSVTTDGYSITSTSNSRILTATTLNLASNVGLTFNMNSSNGDWVLGSITSSTGSSLTLTGAATATHANRLDLTSAATSSVPIVITATGAGESGICSKASGVVFNGNISNSSASSLTILGATSGNSLSYGGIISGTQGLQFSAGDSGGAGTITLNAPSQYQYSGPTIFNSAVSATVVLGNNNVLPSATDVTMSDTTSNGGSFNLNGFNQTIGSLQSNVTNSAGITNNGASTSTLTISGSDTPANAFTLNIVDGLSKVALTRSGTGSTTLTGTNTYTGATTVTGGTLYINGTNGFNGGMVASNATVSGGVLAGNGLIDGTVAVQNGGTIAPGGSATKNISTLNTGAETWFNGGSYNWQLFSGTGVAGAGFDQLIATSLDLTNVTSANGFNLNLSTLKAVNPDQPGAATNFSATQPESWTIVQTSNPITGFNPSNISINSSNFTNTLSGSFSLALDTTGDNLVLSYTPTAAAVNLTWNGNVGSNGNAWNTNAANKDWLDSTPVSSAFTSNNNVTFTNTGAGAVVIDSGGVTAGTISFTNDASHPYTLSGGPLGGSGPLTVSGGGMVTLASSNNNYAGGTNINSGTLQLGVDNALPMNTDVVLANASGAVLDLNNHNQTVNSLSGGGSSGGNVTLGTGTLTLGGSTSAIFSGVISGSGSLVKEGAGTFTFAAQQNYSGSTTITAGKLALLAGTGFLPSTTAVILGDAMGANAALDTNSNTQTIASLSGGANGGEIILNASTFTVGDSTNTTFAGGIEGASLANFFKQGSGTLTLTGSLNVTGSVTYKGTVNVTAGTLQLSQPAGSTVDLTTGTTGSSFTGNLGIANGTRVNFNAGTFAGGGVINVQDTGASLANNSSLTAPLLATIGNNINLNSNSVAGPFVTNIGSTSGNTLTISGIISGNSDVNVAAGASGGAGLVFLSGANNYTGQTIISNATTGLLQLGIDQALPATTAVVFGSGSLNVGAIDLNGHNQSIASLASNTTGTINGVANGGGPAVLTISGSAITTYAGTIGIPVNTTTLPSANNNISLTLDPANTGTLSLTGVNGYTGDTTIHGGTLAVNGTGSINSGGGNVNIGGGSTNAASSPTLAGTGTISGPTNVNAAGAGAGTAGHVSPGTVGSTLGTLTFTNGLTFAAGSNADFTLAVPSGSTPITAGFSSLISVTDGALTLPTGTSGSSPGSVVVNLTDDANASGQGSIGQGTYELFSFGSLTNGFDPSEFTIGTSPLAAGTTYAFNQSLGANTIDLTITAIVSGPQNLTFTGTTDGNWNINSTTNFTAGAGAVVYHDGDNVTFNDAGNTGGQYNITLTAGPGTATNSGSITPGSVTVSTTNTYTFGGVGIAGSTGLSKSGTGTLILNNANTYTGNTNITQGTLTLGATGSIANSANVNVGVVSPSTVGTLSVLGPTGAIVLTQTLGTLNVNNGAVNLASVPLGTAHVGTHTVLSVGGLSIATTGVVDLTDNVMVVRGGASNLSTLVGYLKSGLNSSNHGYWNGTTGIVSSTAATGDSRYLTTIGYRAGDGTTGVTFEGTTGGPNDVVIAYTYYGDADLNGQLNGADYTQIDNGFAMHRTGWSNGDFNYDGVVDGTDFALIDNTYNQLTALGKIATPLALAAPSDLVASPSALIASPADISAVPEPTTLGLLGIGAMSLLTRRRRR